MQIKEKLLHAANNLTRLKTISFLDDLKRTEEYSLSTIKDLQWNRLKELLDFAYKNSDFYKSKFSELGLTPKDLKCLDDFSKLPIVTQEELTKHRARIKSGKRNFFVRSSGTAQNRPVQTSVDFTAASKKYAIYLRHLLRSGWDFETKIIHFLPSFYKNKIVDTTEGVKQCLSTFIQNKIAHEFFTSRKVLFYENLDPIINTEALHFFCKKMNSHKKTILMGRSSFLNLLAYNIKLSGLKVIPPKAIINIGEILPEPLANNIASVFSCPVQNIYGCAELSYIAGSCGSNNALHINEESHYVEIISDPDGKGGSKGLGKIIVTDLLNYSMPLIRYEVRDIGYIKEENCNCGGLRLLALAGRKERCLKLRDKDPLSEKEICDRLLSNQDILQFYLEVHSNGKQIINIVRKNTDIKKDKVVQILKTMGLEDVTINFVDKLTNQPKNKFQYVKTICH